MHSAVIQVARRLLVGAVATLSLAACQNESAGVPDDTRLPAIVTATPATPAVPDAATALAAQDAADKAKARQHGGTSLDTSNPASTMSKGEESRSMPQPGQANDHSTLAPDKSQAKQAK